ncbi:MAG: hypothetical protein WC732_08750 [Candidatus Omnitrophota bacterium]
MTSLMLACATFIYPTMIPCAHTQYWPAIAIALGIDLWALAALAAVVSALHQRVNDHGTCWQILVKRTLTVTIAIDVLSRALLTAHWYILRGYPVLHAAVCGLVVVAPWNWYRRHRITVASWLHRAVLADNCEAERRNTRHYDRLPLHYVWTVVSVHNVRWIFEASCVIQCALGAGGMSWFAVSATASTLAFGAYVLCVWAVQ